MTSSPTPQLGGIVTRSLIYFSRSHLSLAAGVAAATAVIVGALVVGDSVRGSLRGLVVDRLGNLQSILHSRTFFDPQILGAVQSVVAEAGESAVVGPAIILNSATVESRRNEQLLRASQVQVVGVRTDFWQHASPVQMEGIPVQINEDEVMLNAGLALELGVQLGDQITLRFEKNSGIPADNPLGRRDEASINMPRQKVVGILPDNSVGGLSLRAGQSVPKNVFVGLESLQDALDVGQTVNAAWLTADRAGDAIGDSELARINEQLQPGWRDYGLQLDHHQRQFPDEADIPTEPNATPSVVYDYFQLSSKDLILEDETVAAILSGFEAKPQRLNSYLANAIYRVNASGEAEKASEVPYSIVTGVEAGGAIRLEDYTTITIEDSIATPCWINSWLADQLQVKPGDKLQINYFEPETVEGREVEVSSQLTLVGVVPVVEPVRPFRREQPAKYAVTPTLFNDPNMTPSVPGVTDQESISNWDLPFTTDREIRRVDDEYWNNHRLTPKLFLRFEDAASARMFGSRFGRVTSLRFERSVVSTEEDLQRQIGESLFPIKYQKGLAFLPLREQQLNAASGTTPFDMLFLSLSFFVIIAALLLVSLLFRLGIQLRTRQLGLLMAQGFTPQRVRGLLIRETGLVAIVGAVLGVGLGLLYARLMIMGLQTWWLGAISVAFLKFNFTIRSLLIGALCGALASLITISFTLRKLSRQDPLQLIRGEASDTSVGARAMSKLWITVAGVCVLVAVGLSLVGAGQTGMGRAGSFFGCGMVLLTGALIAAREWLASRGAIQPNPANASLLWLAWLAVCRNPVRSVLSLGLLSVASFLIASMGVFQMSPTEQGYGGFDLLAESSQPVYRNIGLTETQQATLGDKSKLLEGTRIISFRARMGEDASCNNLFQTTQPTVLGVPRQLAQIDVDTPESQRFQWAATVDLENPWAALDHAAEGSESQPIPVVLDQNTAMWSLHQGASLGAITKLQFNDQTVYFKTVGLLSNSVLQGRLMIGEENFKHLFPKLSGYQFFMIDSGELNQKSVMEVVESGWSDEGLDAVFSRDVLSRMLSVQNTYISAFQSLGALGLLLGTFGLAAVQTRSVIERRRELSLMRAVGFSTNRIARLLTLETALLLVGGILIGVLTAACAIVPYILEVGPQTSLMQPLWMLAIVLLAGFIVALLAIRTAMNMPILTGLRSE
jgi:putative ABC transport system permease protein